MTEGVRLTSLGPGLVQYATGPVTVSMDEAAGAVDDLYNSIAVTDAGRINHRKSRTNKDNNATADRRVVKCGTASRPHAGRGLREFVHFMKHKQQFADDDREPDIIGYGEV